MMELMNEIEAAPPTARHGDEGKTAKWKGKAKASKAQIGEEGTTTYNRWFFPFFFFFFFFFYYY